jgi:CRP/FNR family cyclic AMP-dependent transcriptional regulator
MSTFFDYPDGSAGPGGADDLVFLGDLSRTEWDRLVEGMERRRYGPGEDVLRFGEVDRSLYLVASGSVDILVPDGDGERAVRVQGTGTVFGEVAFFDGRPRTATVRANTATELLRLGPEAFTTLAARYPDLGRKVVLDLGRILAVRLRQAEARGH